MPGFTADGATESVSLDEWRRAMDINLYGVLLPCRASSAFSKKWPGQIVVLSGGGATNPMPNISAYAASKAPSSGWWKPWPGIENRFAWT